jgi:hypothetical protein
VPGRNRRSATPPAHYAACDRRNTRTCLRRSPT